MVILQLHEQPPLIQAIFAGDLEGTKELLNNNVDVNLPDSEKRTALHAASFKADASITAALLESGARVNAKDAKWITPLHRACSVNAAKVVALLLSYNADISARDRFWQTPLHIAAANNAYESLELLLDSVPNLDVTDRSGKTALHHAAYNGHFYIADLLISEGSVVNSYDKKYFRPLHCAAQMGHVDTINLLIKCGADVNASDWNQYTALHVAAANGNDSVCRLLLNAGANVDSQNTYGNTPLHIACLNGQQLVCQDLVSAGADTEAINFRGQTPIHIAAASAHGAECMMFLLSQSVDVNKRSLDGRTPLHMTAIHGRFTRSKALIDQGAIIDCTDKNGCTPLHIAAQYGHDLLANTLMLYGANPSYKGLEGRTPLHMCCLSGFVECCRKFLAAGVDLNAVDDGGKTPLHCAAYKGSVDCLDLLVSNGAKLLEKDNIGRLPLHYSASQGHYQCVFTLVGIGSPTNAEDNQGCTPLHLAAGYGQEGKCVEYLLQHSADPLRRDKNGFTPLHYATAGNNTNAVLTLLEAAEYASFYEENASGGVTPLHLAAKMGNDDAVTALLQHGANVNVQDVSGVTPLIVAAREGHVQCVQALVRANASIKICDKVNNMTAIHHSAKNGHHECLLQMLTTTEGQESVNMCDSLQQTPLMLAVTSNHIECVRALLDFSVNIETVVNMVDGDSHSSLFRAVVFGHIKIVGLLLVKNAIANLADVNGKRVIHLAAACGHLTCLQVLIEFLEPEDITVMDSQECTALHWACYKGNASCVEFLLQRDVFKSLIGNKFSPVHCASFSGSIQCLRLLVNYYGKETVHLKDTRQRYPLHICALHGHYDVAKYLLEQGSEVDCLDEEGRTPFIAAAQFGQNQIIELLLKYKTNKTYQDKFGNTALHWACHMKHNTTALLLLKDMDDSNVIHSINKENKTALHLAARNGLADVTQELLKKGASVFAVDSEGYTPALCCAPNNQVAQCLALILLSLKNETTEVFDSNQSLHSFLQNVSQQSLNQSHPLLEKKHQFTQTSMALSRNSYSFNSKRILSFNKPSWSTSKTSSNSSLTSTTEIKSLWRKDKDTGKNSYGAEDNCFLIEENGYGDLDATPKVAEIDTKKNVGLNLHRSFSNTSIYNYNERKINLPGTLRVQHLKELSDRKKECRQCHLWQKRCSDCTMRYILRQHLQGKLSTREFNEFLMKALSETSEEYRQKLLQALEVVGKQFDNSRNKVASDIRRVLRPQDKNKMIAGRNRRTQIRMDTRDLTSYLRKSPTVRISSWAQRLNSSFRNLEVETLTNQLFLSDICRTTEIEKLGLFSKSERVYDLGFNEETPYELKNIVQTKNNLARFSDPEDLINREYNELAADKITADFIGKINYDAFLRDDAIIKKTKKYTFEKEYEQIDTEPISSVHDQSLIEKLNKEAWLKVIPVALEESSEQSDNTIETSEEEVISLVEELDDILVEEYLLPPKKLGGESSDTLDKCLDIIPVNFITEEEDNFSKNTRVYMVEKNFTISQPEPEKECNKILELPFITEQNLENINYNILSSFQGAKILKSKKDFSCTLC
ncbi:hypothetical protein WA026_000624 [Henosepilachna vigintioctopunctata]|uniref:Serine/threonine-protein phosphatase 6 regulatory ankyrin repeat subunit A n=1 Tax=Henosepilachna vigintioctopunctata TaxID=420089 RepID=A0AAW1UY80_9CUCU